jgi:SAM-dependent methyltransferase
MSIFRAAFNAFGNLFKRETVPGNPAPLATPPASVLGSAVNSQPDGVNLTLSVEQVAAKPVEPITEATGEAINGTIAAVLAQVEDVKKFDSQIVHLKQLGDPGYRLSYNWSVLHVVKAMLAEIKTRTRFAPVVLDFGCWSGTTTRYISDTLGVGCIGAEINQTCLEFGRRYLETRLVTFVEVEFERIHCADETFDVVLANAVFANMFPAQHEIMMRELIRVTKPGGAIIVIDSNNPDSPEVQARLRHLYQILEGEGGSYLAARRSYIDTLRPATAPNDLAARETCYATTADIEAYLEGRRAASVFDPASMVAPFALSAPIAAPSTVTDHKLYADIMQKAGMSVTCGPGYPAHSAVTTESSFVLIGKKHAT